MLTSISGKLGSLKTAFQKIRAGCDHYNVKLSRAIASAAKLYALKKFSLKEIIGYALYVPKIRQDIPVLISK